MADLQLYSFEGCPFAQRTRMTLLEKGVDFELHEIDLFHRPDWFREVSPYGKVPALRHGDTTVYESAIINQYLDEAFPEPPLMPATPALRAQARIWMDYCESRFLPITQKLVAEADDPARRAANNARLTEVLQFMEREGLARLGPGPWFVEGRFSLVDLQFAPFLERFGTYEQLAGATWPADCPRLTAWFAALRERPSYQATAHDVAYHLEVRRRLRERLAARGTGGGPPMAGKPSAPGGPPAA